MLRFPTRARKDEGAAAVEFALIVPLLLLLVFGIIVYGFVFNAKLDLQTQARNTARTAAAEFPAADCDAIAGSLPSDPILGSDTTVAVEGCANPAFVPCVSEGDSVVVTVTTTFNNPISLIPAPQVLVGEGEFVCEGV